MTKQKTKEIGLYIYCNILSILFSFWTLGVGMLSASDGRHPEITVCFLVLTAIMQATGLVFSALALKTTLQEITKNKE